MNVCFLKFKLDYLKFQKYIAGDVKEEVPLDILYLYLPLDIHYLSRFRHDPDADSVEKQTFLFEAGAGKRQVKGRQGSIIHRGCKGSRTTGLTDHLPEILVLRGNGGEVRGNFRGPRKMGVAEWAPANDGTGRPVNEGIVSLEPEKSQYHGKRKRLNEQKLDHIAMVP